MSIFFIAAMIGMAAHFAILTYEPGREAPREHPVLQAHPKLKLSDLELIRMRKTALLLAVFSFIFVAIFFLLKPYLYLLWDPDVGLMEFLQMPIFGHFVFGMAFGVFAGYWLRTIIFRQRHNKPNFREIALTVLMGVFLFIGLIGERPLSRAFERLTTLEAAGVKIGFASLSPKDESIGPAYDQRNQSERTSISESDGLRLVSLLYRTEGDEKSQIQRDSDQVSLIVGSYEGGTSIENINITDFIKPLVDCSLNHSDTNGDSGRLGDLLQPIAAAMRVFVLRRDRKDSSDGNPVVPLLLGARQSLEALEHENRVSCHFQDEYTSKLMLLAKPETSDVYTYISVAGLLAYGHRYSAAVAMLDRWLQHKRESPLLKDQLIHSIRLRGFLLTLIEEWLHGIDPVQPDKAILDYQLRNIEEQIALLEDDRVINAVSIASRRMKTLDGKDRNYVAGRFTFPPDDHEACVIKTDVAVDKFKTALYLERSLISTKLNWVAVALDNPDYATKYQAKAKIYVKELLNLDFSCLIHIDNNSSNIDIMRKNTLEAFARVSLSAALRPDKETSTDEIHARQSLEKGLQAVNLAEYVLEASAKKEEIDLRVTASTCQYISGEHEEDPPAKPSPTRKCMLHPIVKNFTAQAKSDLKVLKRQLKQALQAID